MWKGVEIVGALSGNVLNSERRASWTERLGVELEFRAQHFQAWKSESEFI